jgi:hypothetical protein
VAVCRLAQTVCAACVLVAVGVAVLGFVAAELSHLLGDGGDAIEAAHEGAFGTEGQALQSC